MSSRVSVEYVVVGGYAVIAHGFPRTIGALDIWVRPTAANARRVVRARARFGYTAGEFEEDDFKLASASVRQALAELCRARVPCMSIS